MTDGKEMYLKDVMNGTRSGTTDEKWIGTDD